MSPDLYVLPNGRLGILHRARLRTLIARMVVDDPMVTDGDVAAEFHRQTGVKRTPGAIAWHRRRMDLPTRPMGRRYQ